MAAGSLRLVCAPDKFRDSLTAAQVAAAMAAGGRAAGWTCVEHPIADGGEGTIDVLLTARPGELVEVAGVDALAREHASRYAILADGTAVIVAADSIGLALLDPAERDPLKASSAGLAYPLLDALERGATRVVVCVGGTATMDGGLGFLAGLGVTMRGLPEAGPVTGASVGAVLGLDLTRVLDRLRGKELIVASDVAAVLAGPQGAARTYAPQKGADEATVAFLDEGLARLADVYGPLAWQPGAGAAGGLGVALMALGAHRISGADFVLDATGFVDVLEGADLCLTGEGRIDQTSGDGKAVSAVLRACERAGVPCVLLGGAVAESGEELYGSGAGGLFAVGRQPQPLLDALASTGSDVRATARAVCELAASMRRRGTAPTP